MTNPASAVVERWVGALETPATSELVRDGFWYIRLPGDKRRWIPIEIEVGSRTTKFTSHVLPAPIENAEAVYTFLLRHNHSAGLCSFGFDGREAVITLVSRVESLDDERIDLIVGAIVAKTEETFRSILEMGFGSLLNRGK